MGCLHLHLGLNKIVFLFCHLRVLALVLSTHAINFDGLKPSKFSHAHTFSTVNIAGELFFRPLFNKNYFFLISLTLRPQNRLWFCCLRNFRSWFRPPSHYLFLLFCEFPFFHLNTPLVTFGCNFTSVFVVVVRKRFGAKEKKKVCHNEWSQVPEIVLPLNYYCAFVNIKCTHLIAKHLSLG